MPKKSKRSKGTFHRMTLSQLKAEQDKTPEKERIKEAIVPMSLKEVMQFTKKSRNTILQAVNSGVLPAEQIGKGEKRKSLRFNRTDIEAWLEGKEPAKEEPEKKEEVEAEVEQETQKPKKAKKVPLPAVELTKSKARITMDEKSLIDYLDGVHMADFQKAIWRAVTRGSFKDLAQLSKYCPGKVAAWLEWVNGDLASRTNR